MRYRKQYRLTLTISPRQFEPVDNAGWLSTGLKWQRTADGARPYPAAMEGQQELPDLPPNAALLEYLRGQASRPAGPGDYALGDWQLHTHPDLIDRLCELAPGWPLTAAYGVPLLASHGVAAVVALGTGWLAVRLHSLPADVMSADTANAGMASIGVPSTGVTSTAPKESWPFATEGWHIVSAWQQPALSAADQERAMRDLVTAALTQAAALAA